MLYHNVIARKNKGGGEPVSGASLTYNADHASGTNYGVVGGSPFAGTFSGGGEPIGTAPSARGNSLYISAANKFIYFPITASNIINQSEFRIKMSIYVGTITGVNALWEMNVDGAVSSTDYILSRIDANGTVYFRYEGNNVVVAMNTTNAITENAWNTLLFRASVTNNIISVKVNANSWENDTDTDTINALNVTNNRLVFGEDVAAGYAMDTWQDDIEVYNTYDAAWNGE